MGHISDSVALRKLLSKLVDGLVWLVRIFAKAQEHERHMEKVEKKDGGEHKPTGSDSAVEAERRSNDASREAASSNQ